ncbi:hypothetical protein [Streptomyces sp. NPDC002402]
MTSRVFAHLLQQIQAGESFVERRHSGCLRPQLLGNVRTTAIASWHRERDTLSPDFRDWVAAGSRWPWGEDGQLALAFERLPAITQCLLWHSVVERDDPELTARITGLAPRAVPAACDQARSALREARTDLYLERLELPDCRDMIRKLDLRPEEPPAAELTAHLRSCPACMSVYKDVSRLDNQLEAQLPVRLLGWWTGQHYLYAKAAISVPLGDPPFLARLLERARADTPAEGSRPRRATAATTSRRRGRRRRSSPLLPRRSPTAFAVSGFLAGVGVGMLMLTACDEQRGPQTHSPSPSGASLSARNGVQADQYMSQQETYAGPAPGTRVLGSSSVLRYDRVDFSSEGDTSAQIRLAGPPGGGAWTELRLDSLAQSPLAQIMPTADGSVADVSVPITPVDGVHRVYVVAHCPTGTEPCIELHSFGTASSPPSTVG